MTTTTSERDAALARLREVVKPGDTVQCVRRGSTRSGTEKITVHVARQDITTEVATVTGLRLATRGCIGLIRHGTLPNLFLTSLADRLSVALFGEPGLIKGEYL